MTIFAQALTEPGTILTAISLGVSGWMCKLVIDLKNEVVELRTKFDAMKERMDKLPCSFPAKPKDC